VKGHYFFLAGPVRAACLALTFCLAGATASNQGAALVQANGCTGCHGAQLKGTSAGPALYGIEHRRSAAQISEAIVHPRAPMPSFDLSANQVSAIVAYLWNLDGGTAGQAPVVTFNPASPIDQATITVKFSGNVPHQVSVLPVMQMGSSTMQTRLVHLRPSGTDPHIFTGHVVFSMGGPWTVKVQYDGSTLNVPLTVGQ
jgi:hypothetical protein